MRAATLTLTLGFTVSLSQVGCVPADDSVTETVGESSQEIIGGTPNPADLAVVMLGGFCTGTLIAPRVVLTAAHCIANYIESGNTSASYVAFGDGQGPWIETIDIVDMAMHRLYDPPTFQNWDIAAVRLAEPAPAGISPIPFNTFPLDATMVGTPVRTIGFGVTDAASQTGGGTKRLVNLTLDEVTYYHVGVGDEGHNICQGDSGGPTMAVIDGVERIIGVASYGSDLCRARSYTTRVDTYQDWITEVVDAWDGPCSLDGTCSTAACRTLDPDCDICGFDGVCGTDCERVDLDCPAGARAGEACEDKYDCESRDCLVAPDEPLLSYCSSECDPARPLDTCEPPLAACIQTDEGPRCTYGGPTPSAQGAPCQSGADCRSGACDAGEGICVEACSADSDCASPYVCEELSAGSFCTFPQDEGGCAVQSPNDNRTGVTAALSLLLAAVSALLWRRRHRS